MSTNKVCHNCRWYLRHAVDCLEANHLFEARQMIRKGLIGECKSFSGYVNPFEESLKEKSE